MQRAEGGNHPLSRSPSPRGRRPRAEVPSAAPAAETRREGLLEEDAAVPPTARPSPLLRHASSATLAAMEGKRVFAFGVSGWCGSILASEIKSHPLPRESAAQPCCCRPQESCATLKFRRVQALHLVSRCCEEPQSGRPSQKRVPHRQGQPLPRRPSPPILRPRCTRAGSCLESASLSSQGPPAAPSLAPPCSSMLTWTLSWCMSANAPRRRAPAPGVAPRLRGFALPEPLAGCSASPLPCPLPVRRLQARASWMGPFLLRKYVRGAIMNFADPVTTPARLQGNMEVSGAPQSARSLPTVRPVQRQRTTRANVLAPLSAVAPAAAAR